MRTSKQNILRLFLVIYSIASLCMCQVPDDLQSTRQINHLLKTVSDENLEYWVEKERETIYESEKLTSFISYIDRLEKLNSEYRSAIKYHPCQFQDRPCIRKYAEKLQHSDSILINGFLENIHQYQSLYNLSNNEIKHFEGIIWQEASVYNESLNFLKHQPDSDRDREKNILSLEALYGSRLNQYKEYATLVTGYTRLDHPILIPVLEIEDNEWTSTDSLTGNLYVVSVLDAIPNDRFIIGNDTIKAELGGTTPYRFIPIKGINEDIKITWERRNPLTGEIQRFTNQISVTLD